MPKINPPEFVAEVRNPDAIQEGWITEELNLLDQLGVHRPVVILLSDHGCEDDTDALARNQDTVKKRYDFTWVGIGAMSDGQAIT